MFRIDKWIEIVVLCLSELGEEEIWVTANGYKASSWGDKNVLKLGNGDDYTTLRMYKKPLSCTF